MADPILSDLISAIYGDTVSKRQVLDTISKSGGSMPKDASLKEARTGQALNAVATVGALNALRMAGPEFKHARSIPKDPNAPKPQPLSRNAKNKALSPTGRKVKSFKLTAAKQIKNVPGVKTIARNPRKAAVVATGGLVGLHSTELVGDMIAARALHRSAQKAKYNEAQKTIKKSLDDVIQARREGRITTEQAITLADEIVQKAAPMGIIRSAARALRANPNVKISQGKINTILRPKSGGKIKVKRSTVAGPATAGGKVSALKLAGAGAGVGGAVGGAAYLIRGKKAQNPSPIPPAPTVAKADSGMSWKGEISKVDVDKRQVFGWCSLTSMNGQPVIDLQGDYVPLEEIEKAAYEYVIHSRKGGDMHARDGLGPKHTADLIESFLVTPEKLKQMGLSDDSLPHGWWIGMKVNDDEQWNLVKNGGRTGFSIHGKGSRIEKML